MLSLQMLPAPPTKEVKSIPCLGLNISEYLSHRAEALRNVEEVREIVVKVIQKG
jgi:hypothetical protein